MSREKGRHKSREQSVLGKRGSWQLPQCLSQDSLQLVSLFCFIKNCQQSFLSTPPHRTANLPLALRDTCGSATLLHVSTQSNQRCLHRNFQQSDWRNTCCYCSANSLCWAEPHFTFCTFCIRTPEAKSGSESPFPCSYLRFLPFIKRSQEWCCCLSASTWLSALNDKDTNTTTQYQLARFLPSLVSSSLWTDYITLLKG